jgi:hypothetical protein
LLHESTKQENAEQENAGQEGAKLQSAKQESAKQENAKPEPEDVEEDVAPLTLGAALTLDLLSDHDDWPNWLIDGIDHLQIISTKEPWITFACGHS